MNLFSFKEILGALSILITFAAFIPYIRSIKRGRTKPHVFSWVIWGVSTLIVFFAQYAGHGGAGSWSTGISGLITCYIAFLAYQKKADIHVHKSDWAFFILALSAIPFWYITDNPLWAVIILTTTDTLGLFPTLRKAYNHPFEEPLTTYHMINIRNIIAIAALEHFSPTTLLFPSTMILANVVLIATILVRRKKKPHQKPLYP